MNIEFLGPVVNFIVVLSVFVVFGRKPFGAMLASRSETVKKEMGEAEALFKEASKNFNEYENNFKNREAISKKELEDAKAMIARHRERTITAAKNEADRIKREAQMMGSNEVEKAKEDLQRELAQKSLDLAEQFLSKQLDPKEKTRLVGEYVELVGNGPS